MSLRPDWAIWDTRSPKQGRWIESINYIINYISSWFSVPFENLCVLDTHVYSVQTCERSERRPTASSLTAFSLQREGLESQDMSLEWGWQPTNHNAPPVSTSAHPPPQWWHFRYMGPKTDFTWGAGDANSESHVCTASDFTHGAISPAPSIHLK